MISTPRVAVVGGGYWGKNLVRNMDAHGVLAAICDPDPDRLKDLAEKYPGAAAMTSYSEVLSRSAITAVVIATPAEMHAGMVREALLAGKDVYVEKPLCLTESEGQELVGLAEKEGRILMVGHLLWYHPAVLKLKDMIDRGELGRIQYIYSNRLNLGKIRREENILWSFAPHDISVILGLLGEMPDSIRAQGGHYLHQKIDDVTVTLLTFPSGVKAHIFVSWLHPFKEQKLVVVGDRKMAVFNDLEKEAKLVTYAHSISWQKHAPVPVKAEGEVVPLEEAEPLFEECGHFLQCIARRQPPRTDGREGLRVLSVLQRCQQALDAEDASPKDSSASAGPASGTDSFVHPTAVVAEGASIGSGTKVWHFSHIMKGARVGRDCRFGQNCHVASGVVVGDRVKAQNNVSIYAGTVVEDEVFLGPSCVLTNVTNPRSEVNRHALYEKTLIRRGATIGANATVVCGITVGRYAFVAAGAVVTRDVPDYALVQGNPARKVGWMSRHGQRLGSPGPDGVMVCPESGFRYRESSPDVLVCLDLDENQPLPETLRKGTRSYDEFKAESRS